MKFAFVYTLFLFFPQFIFAQIFPFRQYTSADELTNSNVYDIIQDKEGYLWFATDNGISRFDGSKFSNFNIHEGLTDNIITSICTDEEGNIWAATKGRGILKFVNGKFKAVIKDSLFSYINNKILVHNNIIYSLDYAKSIYAFDISSEKLLQKISFPADIKPTLIYQSGNGNILCGTNQGVFQINQLRAERIGISSLDKKQINYFTENKDTLIIASGNNICWILNNTCRKEINFPQLAGTPINNLLIDNYGYIWLSTYQGNKLYLYKDDSLQELNNRMNLFNTSVNDMLEDGEGNIWLATYGRGIYSFHHLYCTNYTEDDGLEMPFVTALHSDATSLYVGTYDGLFIFDNAKFTHYKTKKEGLEYIKYIFTKDGSAFICSGAVPQNYVIRKDDYTLNFLHASFCLPDTNNTFIYGSWNNNIRFLKNNKTYDSLQLSGIAKNRVNVIYKTASGEIWCGTQDGLFIISSGGRAEKIKGRVLNSPVTVIAPDKNNNLWVGTSQGIVKYQADAKTESEKWNQQFTHNSNKIQNITSIAFDNKNRPWIGTLSGLYIIENDDYVLLDANSCLLSEEVYALTYDEKNNLLWAGTNAGLSRIDVSRFDALPTYAPKVSFRNIRTQDGMFRADLDTILPYNRNNITLRFSAIHFTNPLAVKFFFKLDNGEYQPAVGRQVDFAGLAYGKHTVTLVAENDRGLKSIPADISVTIGTPYWATWWFKIAVFLVSAFIVFYFIRWRFTYEKEKQKEQLELQTKISELRHQALNTSMNPHFIFNSLNSIQQFINSHNTEEASEYLGKFARLIRLQLNSGNKTFITLEEELDRMNRYLELEKIRFGTKLNYLIHVQPTIDIKNIEIPNMILQPFIENAIWHGILPMNKPGLITIDFSRQNGTLKVFVEDNGIGIKESEQRKKNNHKSLGMHMILERIQLLKKLNGNDISVAVKDRGETESPEHGTRVEIELAIQNRIN